MAKKKIKAIERPEEYAMLVDIEIRRDMKKSSGWLPFEVYELVQCGYPVPNH